MFVRDGRFFSPTEASIAIFQNVRKPFIRRRHFCFFLFQNAHYLKFQKGALNFIPSHYSDSHWSVTTSLISSIKVSNDVFTMVEGDSSKKILLRILRRISICPNFPKKLIVLFRLGFWNHVCPSLHVWFLPSRSQ